MAIKIYLSPAAHGTDNPCSHSKSCGENIHANLYMDELIPYLKACGFEYKRNAKKNVGSAGVKNAVKESNAWGADLHYTVHTNAFNGTVKGSRPMVYPTGNGKKWAEVIKKYRAKIYPYPITIKEKTDLYELNQTRAVCIYEELVFHDNKEDAAWLHKNMRLMAEYTVRAFCEIFNVKFVDPYIIKGDVDGDKKVTSTDARLVLQESAGKVKFNDKQKQAADVDGDGKVTSTDARLILQHTAGKIDKFPTK
jgi:hypothetical protein